MKAKKRATKRATRRPTCKTVLADLADWCKRNPDKTMYGHGPFRDYVWQVKNAIEAVEGQEKRGDLGGLIRLPPTQEAINRIMAAAEKNKLSRTR